MLRDETGYIPLPDSDNSQPPRLTDYESFDHSQALTQQQQKDWLKVDAHGVVTFVKVSASPGWICLDLLEFLQGGVNIAAAE